MTNKTKGFTPRLEPSMVVHTDSRQAVFTLACAEDVNVEAVTFKQQISETWLNRLCPAFLYHRNDPMQLGWPRYLIVLIHSHIGLPESRRIVPSVSALYNSQLHHPFP